jgi:hypothetical protein
VGGLALMRLVMTARFFGALVASQRNGLNQTKEHYMDTIQKRQQVADQCRAVAHMATAIAQIYSDYSRLFLDGQAMPGHEEQVGERTACLMDDLGDILNGGDAVTEDDAWVNPIMERAREVFPERECPTCAKPIPHNAHATTLGKRYHFECVPKVA